MRLKRILIRSIGRIYDLALKSKDINAGVGVFQGLMFALAILCEETTGRKVENGLRPKDIKEWAETVVRTEELPFLQ